MMVCRDCRIKMVGIMSFSRGSYEKFNRCPRCYGETKHHQLLDNELEFGEDFSRLYIVNNKKGR